MEDTINPAVKAACDLAAFRVRRDEPATVRVRAALRRPYLLAAGPREWIARPFRGRVRPGTIVTSHTVTGPVEEVWLVHEAAADGRRLTRCEFTRTADTLEIRLPDGTTIRKQNPRR